MDRTGCERFWANQFRVLLTLAAWVTPGERDECRHEAGQVDDVASRGYTLP